MSSRDFYEEIWERLPPGSSPEGSERRLKFLLAGLTGGERVLDLGCAEGPFTARIAAHGCAVVGVDVAEEPLRRARAADPALDFRRVPAHGPWPFEDAAFDCVWAGEVIEHVLDTARWLSELRRVLRSGGKLLASTPDHGRIWRLGTVLSRGGFERRLDPRGDHLRFYTAVSIRDLLVDFGFGAIETRGAGGVPGARRTLLVTAIRERF